jgi:hypothetical protein
MLIESQIYEILRVATCGFGFKAFDLDKDGKSSKAGIMKKNMLLTSYKGLTQEELTAALRREPLAECVDPKPYRRQKHDVKIERQTTEYRKHALSCSKCGHVTEGTLPKEARGSLYMGRTSAGEKDMDPTNNATERALRPAVVWKKRSFGVESDRGARYVESMLSQWTTCRCNYSRYF